MWDWAIWGAFVVAGVAGIAALARLIVRALEVWRGIRNTRREVVRQLDELVLNGNATADKVAAAGGTIELQESVARLRVSLARLTVLRTALDEARITFWPVTLLLARK